MDDSIEFLSNEGHIYSTVDEDHFKSTEGDWTPVPTTVQEILIIFTPQSIERQSLKWFSPPTVVSYDEQDLLELLLSFFWYLERWKYSNLFVFVYVLIKINMLRNFCLVSLKST